MVTEVLLNMLSGLIGWVNSVCPSWEVHLPTPVTSIVSSVLAYNDVLPISETLTCCGLVITAVVALLGFKWSIKLVDWIADVLP